jgi:hypothetical protein
MGREPVIRAKRGLHQSRKAPTLLPAMRVRSFLSTGVLLLAVASRVFADDADPISLIGLDLKTAFSTLGLPQQMFPYRGAQESLDNVVFFYPSYLYLFWYKDRVWQVRYDRRSTASVLGLALGMTRDQIQLASSRQLTPNGDSLYFDLDDGDFPLRARLVFASGILTDIYIYRSDF